MLFGVFYRPPNSDSTYFSSFEDSFHLATYTFINDIIITGDFNFNSLNAQHSRKIEALCRQISIYQIITEPTHFTENSSSLLDIILVNNKIHVTTSGVGDPFLIKTYVTIALFLESLSSMLQTTHLAVRSW